MGRAGVLLLLAALARGGDGIERRDHGKRTGKQSVEVSGHAISYEASADRPFVRSVLIHGARYGEGYDAARTSFEVSVRDEKFAVLAKVTASYGLFSPGIFTWVEVPLPEPVRVPRAYRIVVDFAATGTKGVYVGYGDVANGHSSYFRGGREQEFAKGKEWMIRVRTSASERPLRRPPRDLAEALRAAQVPALEAADLKASLARVADAAGIAVVLDGVSAAAPGVPAGSAAGSLDRLCEGCGLSWGLRWGGVYVATRERLERIPAAMPEPADADGPVPHDAVALRIELARRLLDLKCRDLPLEQAVLQVSEWLGFRVTWDPRVDRRQRVTVVAESIRGIDALSLLLLPRGCSFRIVGRAIEIAPF